MDKIQEITPEEIFDKVLPGFEVYEALADLFQERVLFYGKTLSQWTDHLAIDIAKDISPEDLRNHFVQVARNIQQASHFYSTCTAYNQTLSSKADGEKAGVLAKIVYEYANKNAKRPAAAVLDSLAETYFNDVSLQLVISKVLKEFWRERRDILIEVRKCLESIAMSQNMEMKYHEIT